MYTVLKSEILEFTLNVAFVARGTLVLGTSWLKSLQTSNEQQTRSKKPKSKFMSVSPVCSVAFGADPFAW